jgi:hypothetical protein
MKTFGSLLIAATFVFVGCNRAETPAPAPAAFAPTPHATLAQLMQGIPFPASNIIFDTQTTDPGAKPKEADTTGGATSAYSNTYSGWVAVENAALAIQETANLVMIPGRVCSNGKPVPNDQADFRKWASELADAGGKALEAAKAKNLDAMLDVSGVLSDACANCHNKYRETPKQPEDRCIP